MRQRRVHRELAPYVRKARRAGWRITESKEGLLLWPPDGTTRPVPIHTTPRTNGHARANIRAALRRGGLKL